MLPRPHSPRERAVITSVGVLEDRLHDAAQREELLGAQGGQVDPVVEDLAPGGVPVLMIYGTGDSSMPLVQGPARIRASLGAGGDDRLTVRYYRGANLNSCTSRILAQPPRPKNRR